MEQHFHPNVKKSLLALRTEKTLTMLESISEDHIDAEAARLLRFLYERYQKEGQNSALK